MRRRRAFSLWALGVVLCFLSMPASAGPHAKVLPALVLVVASAQASESSTCVGCRLNAQSTGFYINRYGVVVTNYHLITRLGQIDRATLRVRVIEGASQKEFDADIDSYDVNKDLLVLTTARIGFVEAYIKTKRSEINSLEASTSKIYSSGFPKGYPYLAEEGKIKSFIGPTGHTYLWVTSMELKEGQSGSPVYTASGYLIGVAKGSEDGLPKNSFVVPVEHVKRLRDVEEVEEATSAEHPKAGALEVKQLQKVEDLERRELSRTFLDKNGFCEKERLVKWRVEATAGWQIDITTVAWRITTKLEGSEFGGIVKKSDNEIIATGTIRNFGECVKFGDTILARDERGQLGIEIKYTEIKKIQRAAEKDILKAPIKKGLLWSIPNVTDPSTVKFNVTEKDGTRLTYDMSDFNPYFTTSFDALAKTVEIVGKGG